MPTKKDLIDKLTRTPYPKNFSMRELDALMGKCGCEKYSGGRGSGVRYTHGETGRSATFDQPHSGNCLYAYHIKKIVAFLKDIGEIEE